MKIIDLSETVSIVNQYVSELRDAGLNRDRMRFRRNVERIGLMMAYEISKTLDYSLKEVVTPLGVSQDYTYDDDIVVATILRAGLPFQQGFLSVFDRADAAFISAYRDYSDFSHFQIRTEYVSSPPVEGKTLMMVDPMLATGRSLEQCYDVLTRRQRPKRSHVVSIIASEPALAYMERKFADRDVTLWTAAVDPGLNEHSYIVPGLGDAGDLAYGGK